MPHISLNDSLMLGQVSGIGVCNHTFSYSVTSAHSLIPGFELGIREPFRGGAWYYLLDQPQTGCSVGADVLITRTR